MRGYRLYQANRIARRTINNPAFWANSVSANERPRVFGMLRKTRVPCSCWMCRNRRQDDGLTIQERRQMA